MAAEASAAPAPKKAPAAPTPPAGPAPMTRREFLYYIWGASMLLFGGQAAASLLWFAYPRFRAGTFGGVFEVDASQIPAPDEGPKSFAGGRFWLVNIGEKHKSDDRNDGVQTTTGVKALYMVCVHLGCLYGWEAAQNRFNCPCHGSMYTPSGHRIAGPATRNLDCFTVQAVDADGKVLTETGKLNANLEASAINVDGAAKLLVNTGSRIMGQPA
ncbi:MAG TPA: Rieske 2Fe-2S domain-containing protein [Anaerolineales bacterium]|nr:Rieske 2Fe-2S domain-containing protein [Anaerolineales bacterium]